MQYIFNTFFKANILYQYFFYRIFCDFVVYIFTLRSDSLSANAHKQNIHLQKPLYKYTKSLL